MCGINGLVTFNNKTSSQKIALMNQAIRHRGPDHQGIFIDKNVGLGHVRLSIIDLQPRSHQPFIYNHRQHQIVTVFNGEIYNFQEIKNQLIRAGFIFSTESDTEVLAAAYLHYGVNCLEKFNGMFAFAIYDPQKQIIFAARDRFGKKPFKYYLDSRQFIFSSELKAILTRQPSLQIDYQAIDDYLTLGYVPPPRTGFKNIYKLPHAHYLIFNLVSKQIQIEKYYDLDYSKKINLKKEEWRELIDKELEQAVKRRLVADVPLGAFLSGGVDSSAIVAQMSKFIPKIKTFSINFSENDFNESQYARLVAQIYQTDHHELTVREEDLLDNLDQLIRHYEEPYADSSQLPTFLLSQFTKKHVTVALSGDGGDENFGGYSKHSSHLLTQLLKPAFLALSPLLPLISLSNRLFPNDKIEKLAVATEMVRHNIAYRHLNYVESFHALAKKEFYQKSFLNQLNAQKTFFENLIEQKNFSELDKVYYLDFNSYLPYDINVKVDLASMLNALEVRCPFLDHQFVNLTAQIPWQLKTGLWQGKKIFKQAMAKYLPASILYRKKQGFALPLKHWFRGKLKTVLNETLLDPRNLAIRIIKKENIEGLLQSHFRGADQTTKLWSLFSLNLWHKKYFQ